MKCFKIDYSIQNESKTAWVKSYGNIDAIKQVTKTLSPTLKLTFKLVSISIVSINTARS
jgi:hypothetical protein